MRAMKISCVEKERLLAMTPEQKWSFNCGDIGDDGMSGDVAILLGCDLPEAEQRALAAAELYRQGRVQYIVSSGGVKRDLNGERVTEADFMADVLVENGVPREAILLDNEARTTKENMICATLQINRRDRLYDTHSAIIVTSLTHMKRSLALAKALLPRKLAISGYPAYPGNEADPALWLREEKNVRRLDSAIGLLKELVDHRVIDDMEMDLGQ